MTVYVDEVQHPFGQMIMCHLWADALAELLIMVDTIGVQRKWIQQPPKASWVHFDISLGKKRLAIRHGAVLTDRFGPVEHTARLDMASGDAARAAKGRHKLEMVAECRDRRLEPPQGDRPAQGALL